MQFSLKYGREGRKSASPVFHPWTCLYWSVFILIWTDIEVNLVSYKAETLDISFHSNWARLDRKCWAIMEYSNLPPEEYLKKIGPLAPNYSFIIVGITSKKRSNSFSLVIPHIPNFKKKYSDLRKLWLNTPIPDVWFLRNGGGVRLEFPSISL